MAKKATAEKPTGQTRSVTGMRLATDGIFEQMRADVSTKLTKADLEPEKNDLFLHLPVPSLAMRVLMQNECWPSSRFHQVVGQEASYKSTFANEIARWHGVLWGGHGVLAEAETKDNSNLRDAIHRYISGNWFWPRMCDFLEEWQDFITHSFNSAEKRMTDKEERLLIPFYLGVDSLTGKGSKNMVKKVNENGHAVKSFPEVAGLMTQYIQCTSHKLRGWPWTWVGVNHMKKPLEDADNYHENIPGGRELAYQSCFIILLKKVKTNDYKDRRVVHVRMMMLKNSIGPDKVPVTVPLIFWKQEDAPGLSRTHCAFDWYTASIDLLLGDAGWGEKMKDRIMPAVKEIVHIGEKACGSKGTQYWSKTLGVPSDDPQPSQELGRLLEHRTDVLEQLYPVLGVDRMRHLPHAVASMAMQPTYDWVTKQAESAEAMVSRLDALKQQGLEAWEAQQQQAG